MECTRPRSVLCVVSLPPSSLLHVLVAAFQDTASNRSLVGVWKLLRYRDVTPSSSANRPAQPGLFIFTSRYYSLVMVGGDAPRAVPRGDEPSADEKVQAYDSFRAMAGTYEIRDQELVFRPAVAKNPQLAGEQLQGPIRINGDTLTLVGIFSPVAAGDSSEMETIWVRVSENAAKGESKVRKRSR